MEKRGCNPLDGKEVSRVARNQAGPRLPGKQKHPSRVQRNTSGMQVTKGTQSRETSSGRATHSLECAEQVLVRVPWWTLSMVQTAQG